MEMDPSQNLRGNAPEFSVSEISQALKRSVEDSFSYVRVRGEISGFKRAASGHLYLALKDTNAVLDGVCWRGTAQRLGLTPEDGMEVVVSGKLTTYPGRSKYQIVIERMELAGEGALLKLLEDRRRKLQAEGLFDPDRKQAIPYLPTVIGVVTSPTGAVIRDILHRLSDRFPRHVLLWPVIVQGEGASEQIANAIEGFNALPESGPAPRPDVLIVARGGGSLEDLWAFNEEAVVRAAANSVIPLISAVGHETDTTLIDFASDQRAPTPTAAAEMAVPVRRDLMLGLNDLDRRGANGLNRLVSTAAMRLEGLSRGLPNPDNLIGAAQQRTDDLGERLHVQMTSLLRESQRDSKALSARLRSPKQVLEARATTLSQLTERLTSAGQRNIASAGTALNQGDAAKRLRHAMERRLKEDQTALDQIARRLESVSYMNILKRGFAVVTDQKGAVVKTSGDLKAGTEITIRFQDGSRNAIAAGDKQGAGKKQKPKAGPPKPTQGELL